MAFNLVAQFKSGALILKTLLSGVTVFDQSAVEMGKLTDGIDFLSGVDPQYLICLLTFGLAVIIYTTYGGFHAVVWTDVMQGIVMVIGVMIMLPLAITAAGGLETATRDMAKMTPPMRVKAILTLVESNPEEREFSSETWLALNPDDKQIRRLFRLTKTVIFPEGTSAMDDVKVLEITSPHEIDRLIDGEGKFQPVSLNSDISLSRLETEPYHYGKGLKGVYVTGPGPSRTDHGGFLPLSLAISFFFLWALSGAGYPSSMVRLMAFNSSQTLRRSIFTVTLYYSMIYFPLVIIFCCARVVMPGMDAESDRIMPAMAVFLTENIGLGWLAGLLVAAPFAAVMSTVDSFLLMISSALVRDIYQRNINPEAQERTLKYMSYLCTTVVGTAAMLGAVNPPQFLQDIIVYTGGGLAACFLGPMVFALYWPRANVQGCSAGMLAGFGAHLSMYVGGIFVNGCFYEPFRLFNFNPIVVGLFVSFSTVYFVTRMTPPPPEELVRKYFYKQTA
jgi:sodium/pantothenate symporter